MTAGHCLHQIGWSNYPPAGWTPGPGDWPPAPAPPWTRAMRWTWGR